MAHVAVSKYADHLPLYRQEGIFKRFGVELSRSTMCDWMAAAADLLEPIVKAMLSGCSRPRWSRTTTRRCRCRTTTARDQDRPALGLTSATATTAYMVYDYTPDRSGDGPERIFKDFEGYLQADAYSGYDGLFTDGQDRRGRLQDARAAEVLRGADQRPGAVAPGAGVDRRALRGRGRREGGAEEHHEWDDAAWHAFRYELRASDRGRSSTRSTPGWRRSGRRFCPRARSARRSVMR